MISPCTPVSFIATAAASSADCISAWDSESVSCLARAATDVAETLGWVTAATVDGKEWAAVEAGKELDIPCRPATSSPMGSRGEDVEEFRVEEDDEVEDEDEEALTTKAPKARCWKSSIDVVLGGVAAAEREGRRCGG
jgi:hypothetical protein